MSTVEGLPVTEVVEKKTAIQRLNERIAAQMQHMESLSWDDIVINVENPSLISKNGAGRTVIESIKGIPSMDIGAKTVRRICSILHVRGYHDRSKLEMFELIATAKLKYEFGEFDDDEEEEEEEKTSETVDETAIVSDSPRPRKKKKRSKGMTTVGLEKEAASLFDTYMEMLSKYRRQLKQLREESGYDTDASEPSDLKLGIKSTRTKMEAARLKMVNTK